MKKKLFFLLHLEQYASVMVHTIWMFFICIISFSGVRKGTELDEDTCFLTQNRTAADHVTNISVVCHCTATSPRKCYNTIRWSLTPSNRLLVKNYRISFYKYGLANRRTCFKVPAAQSTFNFSEEQGFQLGTFYTFVVSPNPIHDVYLKESLYDINCPQEFEIENELSTVLIKAGQNCVFKCFYTGNPESWRVKWKFSTASSAYIHIQNNQHFQINTTRSFSALSILNVTESQDGKYSCVISDIFGAEKSSEGALIVYGRVPGNPKGKKLGIPIGILLSAVLFLILSIFIVKRRCATNMFQPIRTKTFQSKVYISHCSLNEQDEKLVLDVSKFLQTNIADLTVILDLVRSFEIHAVGGISQWIHEQMYNADRILVLLTQGYLDALRDEEEEVGDLQDRSGMCHKVCAENCFLKIMQYKLQEKVIVINVDVESSDFPDVFKGRPYYNLPKDRGSMSEALDMKRVLDIVSNENINESYDNVVEFTP